MTVSTGILNTHPIPWKLHLAAEWTEGRSRRHYEQWEVRDARGTLVVTPFYVTEEGKAVAEWIVSTANAQGQP